MRDHGEFESDERGGPRPTRRDLLKSSLLATGVLATSGALAACGSGKSSSTAASATAGGKPQRGGVLRVAASSGSQASFDPQAVIGPADEARARASFDCLANYEPDMSVKLALAEDIASSDGGKVWTIKLREAVFHDGKPLTADDVVYSVREIFAGKKDAMQVLPFVDPKRVTAVDDRTVRMHLKEPVGDLAEYLAHHTFVIVPRNFNPKKPVGTGPFAFVSFDSATNVAVYKPFRESWRVAGTDKPYVDELRIVGMAEPAARVSALIGGQIDAAESVDFARLKAIEQAGGRLLESPSGATPTLCMQTDTGPFRDVRVRQAMRLIANRPQDGTNALGGHAKLGNDLFAWFDPTYAQDLGQRQQDLEQAKSLLRSAGQADLRLELYTGEVAPGLVNSGTLFVQEAEKAGVKIRLVKQPASDYYELGYMKNPFFMGTWDTHTLDVQLLYTVLSTSSYNDTNWRRPAFDRLVARARASADPDKRKELFGEAQRQLHDEGGYIIQSFRNYVDGISSKVHGFTPSVHKPLGWYGFEEVWLA